MQRSAPLSQAYLAANPLQKAPVTGIPYFLPDTVVPVTVSGDFVVLPERKASTQAPGDYEYVLSVTIGVSKQIADPNAALMLEYVPQAATDDVFSLQVGSNGLLSTVKSTSTDRSGDILLKLVELAKEAVKLPGFFVEGTSAAEGDGRRIACYALLQKMSVSSEVNLSDIIRAETAVSFLSTRVRAEATGWDYVASTDQERTLAEQYARYLWSLQGPPEMFSLTATVNAYSGFYSGATNQLLTRQIAQLNRAAVSAMKKVPDTSDEGAPIENFRLAAKPGYPVAGSVSTTPPLLQPNDTSYKGVVFRTMVPKRLSITASPQSLKFGPTCSLRSVSVSQNDATFMVADPTSTFVADTSRAFLVQKKVDLAVTDGVLTGIDVDKKSELLAAVSLPVTILKAIASIPGEILNVKVTQIANEQKLTQAQVDYVKAQIDLIKQNKALLDAQKTTP